MNAFQTLISICFACYCLFNVSVIFLMDDEEAEALLSSELQEFRNNLNNLLQFGEAKKKDDEEATARAMAKLQEDLDNPVLQLMGEIQGEWMASTKEMMENPTYQKHMKEISGAKGFQDSIKKMVDMKKDPALAAVMETRMHMMEVKVDNMMDEGRFESAFGS